MNIALNIPHCSNNILYDEWDNMKELNRHMDIWTDWYTDALFIPNDSGNIKWIAGKYSRFTVDYERLLDDPLESVGQGILYKKYGNCNRTLSEELKSMLMEEYHRYISELKSLLTPGCLLIDCHSFPDIYENAPDICIGYNDDWSYPSDDIISEVEHIFNESGYNTRLNNPYSNSISPDTGFQYKSIMIEVNKRCYLDENLCIKTELFRRLKETISMIYKRVTLK